MSDKIPKDAQEKLGQLQLIQQRMQLFAAQKQQLQLQLAEIDNALSEAKKSSGSIYQLMGEILVEKNKTEIIKELEEKKEGMSIRVKSIDNQEKSNRNKSEDLQKELTKVLGPGAN